jgi:hypothetical protein
MVGRGHDELGARARGKGGFVTMGLDGDGAISRAPISCGEQMAGGIRG